MNRWQLLVLAACIAVAQAGSQAAAQSEAVAVATTATPAWMPALKPDQGLVIIFREKRFYGSANAIKVFADEGVALPKVSNGKLVHHYLPPGDHRLYADKRKQRDARIVGIEAGQVYFFEARFEARKWSGADVDLVPVEREEAIRRIDDIGRPKD